MANGQQVAIPRTKFRFQLVSVEKDAELLSSELNDLGSQGFALAVNIPIEIGPATFEGLRPVPRGRFLLLAQPTGVDIVGPGLLG